MNRRVLAVRLDSVGDVLLTGPAIRALAATATVDVLCSGIGLPAARLLPGVTNVLRFDAPWVLRDGPAVDRGIVDALIAAITERRYDAAAVFTSSHQSPLPIALLLRLAGVARIAAVSVDFGGRLLDHRIPGDPGVHEVERALLVAAALDAPRPADDALAVSAGAGTRVDARRVVVHPGSAAPARTLDAERWRAVVAALGTDGFDVVVTGAHEEAASCREVAGAGGAEVATFARAELGDMARLLAGAAAVVSGNTGPMHLAAAVGRPVVAVFAPTVPPQRWHPWRVPFRLLGELDVPCAGCRAVRCPLEVQRCLAAVDGAAVVDALHELVTTDSRLEVVR